MMRQRVTLINLVQPKANFMSQISVDSQLPSAVPKISVLMTVYNDRPEFVSHAIESIVAQSLADFDFIILSDGTTRVDTLAILADFARRDTRICMRLEPHRGLVQTLNLGLTLCRAPLVCRQDADDWSEPQRFEKQAQYMGSHSDIAVVGSAVELCQESGQKLWNQCQPENPAEVLAAFPEGNPYFHGAVCMRTAAVRYVGGYNERLTCSEDYDLLWRLCERYGGANLPDVLYHHRRSPGSVVSRMNSILVRERIVVKELAAQRARGELPDIDRAFERSTGSAYESDSEHLAGVADQQLLSGHYAAALRSYGAAILRAPLRPKTYFKVIRWLAFILTPTWRGRLFGH